MALCAPISLTPSPRRRNDGVGGLSCLPLPFRRRRSTSSDGDGEDSSSSSFFFAAATAAGVDEFSAAATAALFPGNDERLMLEPCWGEQRGSVSEAGATALASGLSTASAALPSLVAAPAALQLLAPSFFSPSSAFFDPVCALRTSSFGTERLRLTDEGGGGDDRSRQPGQGPSPSSLPERLPVGAPPVTAPPQLLLQRRKRSTKDIVVAVPMTRVPATEDGSGNDSESDNEASDREDDDDDDDDEGDDEEEAAAMDTEADHFVRRSSGFGGIGSGSGSGSGCNPTAAAAAAAARAATAEAARLEEAATVLSASLGSQHPQVGKAWLLVAMAHGAGGGGGSGSGGGGERALTKCVCFSFSFILSFPSLYLSRSRARARFFTIDKKNRAYEVCTRNIAAVSSNSSGSSLSRRPSASVGTQWEEGEAAAAAAAVTPSAKHVKKGLAVVAGAASVWRGSGGVGGGKKKKKMASATKS